MGRALSRAARWSKWTIAISGAGCACRTGTSADPIPEDRAAPAASVADSTSYITSSSIPVGPQCGIIHGVQSPRLGRRSTVQPPEPSDCRNQSRPVADIVAYRPNPTTPASGPLPWTRGRNAPHSIHPACFSSPVSKRRCYAPTFPSHPTSPSPDTAAAGG
jgi:hypothetical protein